MQDDQEGLRRQPRPAELQQQRSEAAAVGKEKGCRQRSFEGRWMIRRRRIGQRLGGGLDLVWVKLCSRLELPLFASVFDSFTLATDRLSKRLPVSTMISWNYP